LVRILNLLIRASRLPAFRSPHFTEEMPRKSPQSWRFACVRGTLLRSAHVWYVCL
jgi:hypothetical protein